jgi:hypothetical protein
VTGPDDEGVKFGEVSDNLEAPGIESSGVGGNEESRKKDCSGDRGIVVRKGPFRPVVLQTTIGVGRLKFFLN